MLERSDRKCTSALVRDSEVPKLAKRVSKLPERALMTNRSFPGAALVWTLLEAASKMLNIWLQVSGVKSLFRPSPLNAATAPYTYDQMR